MTEREQAIEYLVGRGINREDAELRMGPDSDLWILEPEGRHPLEPTDISQWEEAFTFFEGLVIATEQLENAAIRHVLSDAQTRVMEARRRARQRARGEEEID